MKRSWLIAVLLFPLFIAAQKKPLDHSVYDSWQSIGEKLISPDAKWIVYTITPQEGDNELVIQSSNTGNKLTVPRGYNAVITDDSRYVVFRIKPYFKETREARIKKKKPDEMPKDSLGIVELGREQVFKIARVKNFKAPEKQGGWVAYHLEKPVEKRDDKTAGREKKTIDSLARVIDSLQHRLALKNAENRRNRDGEDVLTGTDAEGDDPAAGTTDTGTDLVVRNLSTGKERVFVNVLEYVFSKKGGRLIMEHARNPKDSLAKNHLVLYDLDADKLQVISKGGNDFRNFSFSEDGSQLAFVAERDAKPKQLQKFYRIWYFKTGMDTAILLADKTTRGMQLGMTVSEHGALTFSKSGQRLFFGTAPIQPPRDTTLVDIDLVKLDVWHYNDDYLQTAQLSRLSRDLQTNYLAVFDIPSSRAMQIGTVEIPVIYQTGEGDGRLFVGVTDYGKRVEGQWTSTTKKDIYAINAETGEKKLIKKDLLGMIAPQFVSPGGNYITWYDSKAKNYFGWNGDTVRNISKGLKTPLWNEEHDSPSDPAPYGIMGWMENDSALFIYDRYDIWSLDPKAKRVPQRLTPYPGRSRKHAYRYIRTDPEERFIRPDQPMVFRIFNEKNKDAAIVLRNGLNDKKADTLGFGDYTFGNVAMAKNVPGALIFTKENYIATPDLYFRDGLKEVKLSAINLQQQQYNWGTAELYRWKAFDGKQANGILYKPADFNADKKYPVIFYFYETHTNTLHDYIDPAPTGSRLNIPFFVSRGYLVFSPDIKYTIGHPAKSAYNYVVSAAKDLAKRKWVDGRNMGLQGQSWGGIQVAQLVTMTDIFKAAWAGAPVANMTSAYGGIRWESGLNRQFQYEKTQSRIGATLWEKPQLYIENSPLFHLPKVKTPMVIMANDADGAVPWYQGIELFTGMRRLGKKAWLLNYNGEAHNLVERKNKKDIQIREQQFFDWLLKGDKPPKWIVEGIPAVKKGKDWGLELVD
jgi:dipeptidyl aminopeptidase/acylaminoacyl peptidase